MDTKERILALLEEQKGRYISGEEIAKELALTRTAIWKAITGLKKDGHDIIALRNKGYCLSADSDIISAIGIKKYLLRTDAKIEVFPSLTSTNTYAREKAIAGEKEWYVVIASSQTGGKGRKGRSFYSPDGTGLYMSILLRPSFIKTSEAMKLTTKAAVAVCEAIEAMSDCKAEIKWVNDVFVNGKKVCGILTEAAVSMENDCLDYAVLGIGINVSEPINGFPPELKDIAGAITLSGPGGKNCLAAEIINRFSDYYLSEGNYAEKYRERCFVIGKEVLVIGPSKSENALAIGVDDECRLVVRYNDGTEKPLSSGEISVRIKE